MKELPRVNQLIHRKGSNVLWQVWAVDENSIALAHNVTSRGWRISHEQFKKNWRING